MSIRRSARLLLCIGASAGIALDAFVLPGEAEPAARVAAATAANPTPGYRSLEDTFYSDIRPATPEQQLPKSLEKKADAQASYMEGLLLEEEGDYEEALAAYTR